MFENKSYENKFFSVLGDSISTLMGRNPEDYAVYYDWDHCCMADIFSIGDTWWGQVIEALGGFILQNNSFSGSRVSKAHDCFTESYACSDERTGRLGTDEYSPDVIMILMGLNDFGAGAQLKPTDEKNDISVFSVAYDTMLKKLKRNYPESEIWCLTLPYGYESKAPNERKPLVRWGRHISEFCEVIRECAQANGALTLDIFRPDEPYDTIDGYHPNNEGMKTISSTVLSEIQKAVREE